MEAFIEERAFDVGFKGLIGFTRPRRQGRSGGKGVLQAEEKALLSPFTAIPPSQLSSRCFCKSFPLYPLVSSSFWITILAPGLLNPAKEIHKRPKLRLPTFKWVLSRLSDSCFIYPYSLPSTYSTFTQR